MSQMIGIHWSQTTYGNWLHGDERGSWQCGRWIGADASRESAARVRMNHRPVVLDQDEREIVANGFGATVRERDHRVYAATIQGVHIHLVFAPLAEDIGRAIARLKRRSATGVFAHRRDHGVEGPRSLWTRGKAPVFLFEEEHLYNAIEYVRDHNRHTGLPPDPFHWIDPLYPPGGEYGDRFRVSPVVERPPT